MKRPAEASDDAGALHLLDARSSAPTNPFRRIRLRALGLNSRALGTNPRAKGTSKRQKSGFVEPSHAEPSAEQKKAIVAPSHEELVNGIVKLMSLKGATAVADIKRRADAGEGLPFRGKQLDAAILHEALMRLPAPAPGLKLSEASTETSSDAPDLIDLLVQLMQRKGQDAINEVRRKADAGETMCIRGKQLHSLMLQKALGRLQPSDIKVQGAPTPEKTEKTTCGATPEKEVEKPPVAQEHPCKTRWHFEEPSVWVRDYGNVSSSSVAAFDLDGTLVTTGATGSSTKDAGNWMWWQDRVPEHLRTLSEKGYKIVIFTNLSEIGEGDTNEFAAQSLIDNLQKNLGVPLAAFVATSNDAYCKPRIGMWKLLSQLLGKECRPARNSCFFVGDAAGLKGGSKKSTNPDSDLKLALNLGIDFQTPEEFFLQQVALPRPTFKFDPRRLRKDAALALPNNLQPSQYDPAKVREVLLLVGAPCSGKTTLVKSCLPMHVYVSQSELKTKERCFKACEDALREGHSVVIDNQNRDKETRSAYVEIARRLENTPVRVVYLDMPKQLCFHLNRYRSLKGGEALPAVAIQMYYSREEPPVASEGFEDIIHLTSQHFAPQCSTREDLYLIQSFLD